MAWTSHGWHIHGTNMNDPFPPGTIVACENPRECETCSSEMQVYLENGVLPPNNLPEA